ncbi:MAG: DUF819 family protein [Ginsengibacter sp.]
MQLISDNLYVTAVLLLLVVIAEWLGQKKYFHYLGSTLIVIIVAAILANVHLLPSSQDASAVYDGIFAYAAPLGIFFLLLDVRLKDLRAAGLPMIAMFLAGTAFSVAGVLLGYYFIQPQLHSVRSAFAVAGMYTGTYTGGSANLNAVAITYGVNKDGTLFAAINAADNIITTVWMIVTIFLPSLLQRLLPRRQAVAADTSSAANNLSTDTVKEEMSILSIGLLLFLGFASVFISMLITQLFPKIPSILTLTTIALVLAQMPLVHKLKGGKIFGYFLVLLFLAVVGAYCDIHALVSSGSIALTLLVWVTTSVFIHGILLFLLGAIFKQDWYIISIASNANIGGATSAAALAASFGRRDLRLPGILVGSLGTALGTYLGILVAEFLK